MDRAQRLDEKNGVICLIFIFTFGSYSQCNVKNCSFFAFYADDSKTSITVWAKCLRESERTYSAFSESTMDYWILSHH